MKATSFLDMTTLLSATSKTSEEFNLRLAKLILLYNKPPKNLHTIFTGLRQFDISSDDYSDKNENTYHLKENVFIYQNSKKKYTYPTPKNLNELINMVNASGSGYKLEFNEEVVKELDFNFSFKDLMGIYGL